MAISKADRTMGTKNPLRAIGITMGLCLALFVAATIIALEQSPRPTPFAPPSLYDKILFPYEENAFLRLPMVTGTFNDMAVVQKSGHIWAVGNDGLILVSQDQGNSWQRRDLPGNLHENLPGNKTGPRLPPPAPSGLRINSKAALFNWGTAQAWAASKKEYSKTQTPDLRQQYTPQQQGLPVQKTIPPPPPTTQPPETDAPPLPPPHLKSVFFINKTHGWIAGSGGTILHTSDGGIAWAFQETGLKNTWNAVHFTDAENGWICGDGVILSTDNSGKTWKRRGDPGGIQAQWHSVFFLTPQKGWICGQRGEILFTRDSGKTWARHSSGIKRESTLRSIVTGELTLRSIYFTDLETGWACGDDRLFSTRDGGKTWMRIEKGIPPAAALTDIYFSDPQHGWISGKGGLVLLTTDGGRTWISGGRKNGPSLSGISFRDENNGWACSIDGTLLSTSDGGRHWQTRTGGAAARFSSVFFTAPGYGWVAGDRGTLLFSKDGGRHWEPRGNQASGLITALQFKDRSHGWAGNTADGILMTSDGGQSWQKPPQTIGRSMVDIQFPDNTHGWTCGGYGSVLASKDGGQTWENRWPENLSGHMQSLSFLDKDLGWVLEKRGKIHFTPDGGTTWKHYEINSDSDFNAIHFTDTGHGWVCGEKGTILFSPDRGRTWTPQKSGTQAELTALYFTDPRQGWIVGNHGIILYTADSGRTWTPQDGQTSARLTSVHFTDGSHGWTTGLGGTLRLTTDGGRTWEKPIYSRLPAPWFWMLCFGLILVSLFVVRQGNAPRASGETVADVLASDRPLQAGDPDPLGFEQISSGLSRFIANVHTDPPLTIAVTGEWGTGKSSLMNLLYHDLKQRRFHPVWFNAWHHQKGEQLLASLYAQIRSQALPPLWHPAGFQFRLRLLFRRGMRTPILFGLLAFLFFAAFPMLRDGVQTFIFSLFDLLSYLIRGQADRAWEIFSISHLLAAAEDKWFPALLASPAVAAVLKAIRAFGLSPQRLLVLGSTGKSRAGLDPGARSRFTHEFSDVTSSLDLGAMVIFIDDLDRCSKENVVEILETINFLAVSGNCFIILGMARQWVETCVALQFKELAEETGSENTVDSGDGFSHRQRFARQYLEKLINIEVPVPVPTPDGARALLTPDPPEPSTPMEQILTGLGKTVRKYLPIFCILGLAVPAWYVQDFFRLPAKDRHSDPLEELMVLSPSAPGTLLVDDGRIRIPLDRGGEAPDQRDQNQRPLEIVVKGRPGALENGIPIGTLGNGNSAARILLRYRQIPEPPLPDSPAGPQTGTKSSKADPSSGIAAFGKPEQDDSYTGHFLALLTGLGLAVICLVYLVQRPRRFTSDSRTFREALAIWHPGIVLVRKTPRSIKRFLNHLRYVAMRLSPDPPLGSIWQRMKAGLDRGKKSGEQREMGNRVPESVLVALGAVYHVNPEWVKDPEALRTLFTVPAMTKDLIQHLPDLPPEEAGPTAASLATVIQTFQTAFGMGIDDMLRHREAFLAVLAETGM